jgi:hypothetical protein
MLRSTSVLNERKATSFYYDRGGDIARILVVPPPATVRTRTLAADLLLDAEGFLVGVDVDPKHPARVIVMLGRHENIVRKVSARLGVSGDSNGTVCEIRIADAKNLIRAHEKNPYAP